MKPRCLALMAVVLAAGVPAALAQAPPAPPPLKLPSGIKVRVWTYSLPNERIEGMPMIKETDNATSTDFLRFHFLSSMQ